MNERISAEPRVQATKIPFEQRPNSADAIKLQTEIREIADETCEKLFRAFGAVPSEEQISDAPNQIRKELLFIAGMARTFGIHHKNFQVGACMLAL